MSYRYEIGLTNDAYDGYQDDAAKARVRAAVEAFDATDFTETDLGFDFTLPTVDNPGERHQEVMAAIASATGGRVRDVLVNLRTAAVSVPGQEG